MNEDDANMLNPATVQNKHAQSGIWLRYWMITLLIFTAVIGLAAFLNLARDIGKPFPGYLTVYNGIINRWEINGDTPFWWASFGPDRLRYTDKIFVIGGLENRYYFDERAFYRQAHENGEQEVSALIRRDGEDIDYRLPIELFRMDHFLDLKLPELLTGLCFWLLAVLVYQVRPHEPLNRAFTAVCCFIAISRWATPPGLFLFSDWPTKLLVLISVPIISPLMAAAIIHLTLLFPTPSRLYRPFLLIPLYTVTSIVVVCFAASFLYLWHSGPSSLVAQLNSYGFYGYVYLIIGAIGFLVLRLLFLTINPTTPRRERRQCTVGLCGLAIGSLYFIPFYWERLFGLDTSVFNSTLDLRYFLLAIPGAAALATLRYQTFRSPAPFFWFVPIIALSALLAGMGAALWYVTQGQGSLTPFAIILLMVLCASVIWSSQARWRGWLGRLLHWEQRSYNAAINFTKQVIGKTNLQELPEQISATLIQELEIEQAAFYVWDETAQHFLLTTRAGNWPVSLPQTLVPDGTKPTDNQGVVRILRDGSATPPWLQTLPSPSEVAAPLVTADRILGLLVIGKRWDEEIFDERDIAVIELIVQQITFLMLTAIQVEELRRVPRLVDEAQERERTKIDHELHDTIQQFLGRLPFYLEVSRTNPQKRDAILDQCIVDIEDAAKTLRQIRNDLTANQVNFGLVEPLYTAVRQFEHQTGIVSQLQISPEIDFLLDTGSRHALYRVIRQAMDNTAAHAQASSLSVLVQAINGKVVFSVEDNGQGSTLAERELAQNQGSFGLKSMSARIQNLGGEFVFTSSLGQGTKVHGWIPLSRVAQ